MTKLRDLLIHLRAAPHRGWGVSVGGWVASLLSSFRGAHVGCLGP